MSAVRISILTAGLLAASCGHAPPVASAPPREPDAKLIMLTATHNAAAGRSTPILIMQDSADNAGATYGLFEDHPDHTVRLATFRVGADGHVYHLTTNECGDELWVRE